MEPINTRLFRVVKPRSSGSSSRGNGDSVLLIQGVPDRRALIYSDDFTQGVYIQQFYLAIVDFNESLAL